MVDAVVDITATRAGYEEKKERHLTAVHKCSNRTHDDIGSSLWLHGGQCMLALWRCRSKARAMSRVVVGSKTLGSISEAGAR